MKEVFIVPQSNTTHKNIAVVVHFQYTRVTLSTMMCSLRFKSLTGLTISQILLLHKFFNVLIQKEVLKKNLFGNWVVEITSRLFYCLIVIDILQKLLSERISNVLVPIFRNLSRMNKNRFEHADQSQYK